MTYGIWWVWSLTAHTVLIAALLFILGNITLALPEGEAPSFDSAVNTELPAQQFDHFERGRHAAGSHGVDDRHVEPGRRAEDRSRSRRSATPPTDWPAAERPRSPRGGDRRARPICRQSLGAGRSGWRVQQWLPRAPAAARGAAESAAASARGAIRTRSGPWSAATAAPRPANEPWPRRSTGWPGIKTPTAVGAWPATRNIAKAMPARAGAAPRATPPPRPWRCCRSWPPARRTRRKGPYQADHRQAALDWLIKHAEARRRPPRRLQHVHARAGADHALRSLWPEQGLAREAGRSSRRSASSSRPKIPPPAAGTTIRSPRRLGDTSVVGWQVMALKSGEMAGLAVNRADDRGRAKWLKCGSQGKSGGLFCYQPATPATPGHDAVGLLCTQYLGAKRDDPAIQEGMGYLMAQLARRQAAKHLLLVLRHASHAQRAGPGVGRLEPPDAAHADRVASQGRLRGGQLGPGSRCPTRTARRAAGSWSPACAA